MSDGSTPTSTPRLAATPVLICLAVYSLAGWVRRRFAAALGRPSTRSHPTDTHQTS